MKVDAHIKLCAVIGDPIAHSMSPAMHTAGYSALGLNYVFLAFRVPSGQLKQAIQGIRTLGLRGVSVTIPHKVAIMRYLDEIDAVAEKIGAVNTIVNYDGILKGFNTDWQGAMRAVEEKISIQGKRVVILGAGGAARAVGFGFLERKARNITILNRTKAKARKLAKEMGVEYGSLEESDLRLSGSDILVNTTSVGMKPYINQTLVPKLSLHPGLTVMDAVYNPFETRLIREARQAGCLVVPGYRMFLWQGVTQFELYTGVRKAPVKIMEQVLIEQLSSR